MLTATIGKHGGSAMASHRWTPLAYLPARMAALALDLEDILALHEIHQEPSEYRAIRSRDLPANCRATTADGNNAAIASQELQRPQRWNRAVGIFQ
ncbi:MAG TPA: hypothetical protein VE267_18620 [Bradyrhizobium sp.]|nr:hypothetical protein [Bradyrhizobium sp.]